MNFSGKYQVQTQENYEAFMKAVGMPDDIIQKGKDVKGVSEIVQNGKHFKFIITAGSKVIQNEFTLGEECEMEFMTGEKIKSFPASGSFPKSWLFTSDGQSIGASASASSFQ